MSAACVCVCVFKLGICLVLQKVLRVVSWDVDSFAFEQILQLCSTFCFVVLLVFSIIAR